MKINKVSTASMAGPYSIYHGKFGRREVLLAGSERIGEPLNLYTLPALERTAVSEGRGGFMAMFTTERTDPPAIVSAEGLHPNFISRDAGISLYHPGNDANVPWKRRRIVDLPFIHRIALVDNGGTPGIIAATLCGKKDHIDDWSSPGGVYLITLPVRGGSAGDRAECTPLLEGLIKNHGMYVGRNRAGTGSKEHGIVYVSAEGGIYTLEAWTRPAAAGVDWAVERILERPVSELAVFDLDGDGDEEIVTIEPFHGDRIALYKKTREGWEQVFETSAELGHGIWAGQIGGTGCFMHGSRAGQRELCLYRLVESKAWKFEKTVIEAGTGTAQLAVKGEGSRDLLFTSNNHTDEVAVYTLEP
jgi:hypothetical protein